ncbi:dUTPase [Bacillus phage vB_BpsM-61]|nr:dUTPase [Bacillus phage vB_BpsM-61]
MVKTKSKTINLGDMFEKQQALTDHIRYIKGIDGPQIEKDKGAIICELWEVANELKSEGFKYWTEKKRTKHVLEEMVDVLHMYLQIGNDMHVVYEHYWIEKRKTLLDQIMSINTSLLMMDAPLMWAMSFAQYRGLVELLGYDWDTQIIPAYNKKFDINMERQNEGY